MPGIVLRLALVLLALCLGPLSFAQKSSTDVADEQLGRRWAAAVNARDASAFADIIDFESLARHGAATFTDNEAQRAEFVEGFVDASRQFGENMIAQVEAGQGRAIYLRMHSFDGMRGPLVRYDFGTGGTNYLLLLTADTPGTGPRVVDVFVAANGQRLSETVGALSQLLVAPSASLLGKMFGLADLEDDLAETFTQIGELQRQGRTADVYAKINELPEPVRNHRVIVGLATQIAALVDDDLYREELARLARYHGDDPTAAFALIDYYVYEGDTDAAMEATLDLERAFGPDAAIEMLKANVAVAAGDDEGAIAFAEESVALEPDNELSRWTLVGVLMPAGRYADGIRALESLERDFGYEFEATNFQGNEVFDGFVDSAEYAAWLKKRVTQTPVK